MRNIRKVTDAALKDICDELQKISTIGLACKAKSLIEKVLWIALGVMGVIWLVFVFTSQFQDWEENPGMVTNKKIPLKYPAITICPKVSTKYAIAEVLGNFLDSSNLPDELLSLRESFFLCGSGLWSEMDNVHFLDMTSEKANKYYEDYCFHDNNQNYPNDCKVPNILFFVMFCIFNF